MNRMLVRTDHVHRYHLFIDTAATVFDAFRVELLDATFLATGAVRNGDEWNVGRNVADAWTEALAVVNTMRADHSKAPMYSPQVFAPYVLITACEFARESTKCGLRVNKIVGGIHGPPPIDDPASHESRVLALCAALDQVDFLRRGPKVH